MSSITQPTEVVTEAEFTLADLNATAERINEAIERIKGHEDAFEEATLEHRLVIGLEIARAQSAFGISTQERAKLGGDSKAALSRRDKAESQAQNPANKEQTDQRGKNHKEEHPCHICFCRTAVGALRGGFGNHLATGFAGNQFRFHGFNISYAGCI